MTHRVQRKLHERAEKTQYCCSKTVHTKAVSNKARMDQHVIIKCHKTSTVCSCSAQLVPVPVHTRLVMTATMSGQLCVLGIMPFDCKISCLFQL